MRVAAINWKLREIVAWEGFVEHLAELVGKAAGAGAEVVVLPELAVLELLYLRPDIGNEDVPAFLAEYEEAYEEELYRHAEHTGAIVVGGSHVIREGGGYSNACLIAYPSDERFVASDGGYVAGHYQRKVSLTMSEREEWGLEPGEGLQRLLEPNLGVLVCYDIEFPEAARSHAESGVRALCVPAWTQDRRAFQRVRWCCQARAIENEVFVAHASLVGSLRREPVPEAHGCSAVLTPSAAPFPESATLAETGWDQEEVAVADLDFDALETCRSTGDTRNWHDRNQGDWTVME